MPIGILSAQQGTLSGGEEGLRGEHGFKERGENYDPGLNLKVEWENFVITLRKIGFCYLQSEIYAAQSNIRGKVKKTGLFGNTSQVSDLPPF